MRKRWNMYGMVGLLIFGMVLSLWSGTTGKIAGTVVDQRTGAPLPGVNLIVEGTALGAVTDESGNYAILYVPPGVHAMQVSMIGYTKTRITDIRVLIDQTARVDVELEPEVLEGKAVTVVAERQILRPDVATSVVAVSSDEVKELPVSRIENVVGLQAGIQGGLQIRGGGADQALVLMDGVTLRDPRNNAPISTVALSAVKEISIERGGFNAEYGQVRSGIVNVVTREGEKEKYYTTLEMKYSPPKPKHFGISPFDKNSFWLRPYFDDEVCWYGTKGEPYTDLNSDSNWEPGEPFTDLNGDGRWTGWDKYTQREYPEFEGWYAVSERLMSDDDPTNDLSPLGCQRVYMWETRRQPRWDEPDYNIDGGIGGPVPLIGKALGNLRFFTAYRRYREMLVVPLTRDDYVDYDWSMKLTSDITSSMKLMINGLYGKQFTMQDNWSYTYLRTPETIASALGDRPGTLFGTGVYSLSDIAHQSLSAKFTHLLSEKTFYEISLERFWRNYHTYPARTRDKTPKYEVVPGYYEDEAPFGYDWDDELGIGGIMVFGGFTCKRRDSTQTSSTTFKFDFTSQVNFSNLVKTGFEFVYNDLNFNYGAMANYSNVRYEQHVKLHVFPIRTAFYIQDKLETKGFIMNAGLRFDYSNSNTTWWDVDPFDKYFFTSLYNESRQFPKKKTKPQWQLSPRLGISHPITENSKLFFNYGHFKQMPSYETLFRIARSTDNRMSMFGDPNLVLAKTISYELGFDQTLFNSLLVQVAAFYHDIFDQQNTTQYISPTGVAYSKTTSTSYQDIRGFELTLRKSRGRWWTFFGNYTYQVTTSGHFGRGEIYQDPSRQREYDEATVNLYQERPIPRPYARLNLSVYTPDQFGPRWKGVYPLGGYMANLLLNWQEGAWVTWNPKGIPAIANNVQQRDWFDSVLRLSKTWNLKNLRIEGFIDIENLFNSRRMSLANFGGKPNDQILYYSSLHLPKSKAYDNIPGHDKVGDYRKPGVKYQPMYGRGKIDYETEIGEPGVIYYDMATQRYVEYVNGTWQDVEKRRLKRILDDKAYIDMPAQTSLTFFNPRQVFFGIRISFDFD